MPKSRKLIYSIILVNLLVSVLVPITTSTSEESWWDENYSYRQEIIIPIDTSLDQAKFQPIDIHIDFDSSCWAKDVNSHSIRVISQNKDVFEELECQIYDLEKNKDDLIICCNLVFLVPEKADGAEKYLVYYDDEPKPSPNYPDHVKVEESSYFYKPIPGFPFESSFFNIIDKGYSIYQIAQKGKFMGKGTSQQVSKLKDKSTTVRPENVYLAAGFDFKFHDETAKTAEDYISTSDCLVSKKILVDGNLMVQVGIVSKSTNNEVQTTAYYKYYHCPDSDKRLHVHIKHEVKKECKTIKRNVLNDGRYAHLDTGWIKSKTIKELNFGKIFPFLHFPNEEGLICELNFDPDPEYIPPGLITSIIDTKDDVDLGQQAWISVDEGENGVSHGLIFNSNKVIVSGSDERDGIQIKAYEWDYPHLPGLESNTAGVLLTRNAYEKGEPADYIIPKGFTAEFFVDFYSSQSKGYLGVQEESKIFQSLVEIKPSNEIMISADKENIGTNSLTVLIHNSRSLPLDTSIAALTGLNISYVTIDLYKDNKLMNSGASSRLEIESMQNSYKTTGFDKIKSFFTSFDLKDISFFKKICFENLEPGKYLIKIFRKNCRFNTDQKLIGFKVIEVNGDTRSHVFCRPSGSLSLSVFDQKNKPVDGVNCILEYKDVCIFNDLMSNDGKILLTAPVLLKEPYVLKLFYKGFKIFEEPVKFGLKQILSTSEKNVDIQRYNLKIRFSDKLDLPPSVRLNPCLISNQMTDQTSLHSDESDIENGVYVFKDIIPARYNIQILYNTHLIEEEINVDSDETVNLIFPVEHSIKTSVFDSRGNMLDDAEIVLSRMGKKIKFKSSDSDVSVPPGSYDIKVYSDNDLVGKRKANILRSTTLSLVTNQEPVFPFLVIILSVVALLIGGFVLFIKKKYHLMVKLVAIMICIIALMMPWWSIQGVSEKMGVETSSNMFLTPPGLITMTSSSDVISGEISFLPDIFINVLQLVSLFLILGCVLITLNTIFERYGKKRYGLYLISSGLLCFVVSIVIFSFAVIEFANVSIGSFAGTGNLDVSIPGESISVTTFSSWGPSTGFYLTLAAAVIVFISLFFKFKNEFRKNMFFSKKDAKIYIKRFLPLVGIVIFSYLIINIGIENIISTFLKISPFHIMIAGVLVIPTMLIANFQWQLVLRSQNIHISYIKALEIGLIGSFYSAISPGKIGSYMKLAYLKEETNEPYGKLFVNSIIFSSISMLSFFCFLIISALVLTKEIPVVFPIVCTGLAIFLFIILFFVKKERGEKTFHLLIKLLIPKRSKPTFKRFVNTFYNDFPNVKGLILPFLIDFFITIIVYSQIYIIALSLGVEIPYFTFIMILPIVSAVTMLPISPGALGVREITVVYLFSLYGVAPATSIVLSLAGFLILGVPVVILGFMLSVNWTCNGKKQLNFNKLSVKRGLMLSSK